MDNFDPKDIEEFGIEPDIKDQFAPQEVEEFGIEADMPDVENYVKNLPTPKNNYSTLESLASGISDSASLGFTDELTGVVGATNEYLADRAGLFDVEGLETPKRSYGDLYRKYRDMQRQRMKEMQEEDPRTVLAGNIIGGVSIPGGAMAKGGAKGASLVKRAVDSAKGAGALGAAYGAGSSEADTLMGVGEDALKSGAVAGSIGAGMPLAAAGAGQVKNLGKKIGESDIGQIFKSYLKGEDLAGDVQKNLNKLKDLGGATSSELSKRTGEEAVILGEFMEQAADQGKTVNSQQMISNLNELVDELPDTVSKNKIIKKINEYVEKTGMSETDSPVEVFKLFKDLKKNMAPSGKDLGERRVFAEMDQVMKEELQKGVDSLPESYSKMSEYLSMIEAMTGKTPSRFQSAKDKVATRERMGNLLLEQSPEMKNKTKLLDIMEGFEDPLRAGNRVKGLKDIAPDLAQRIEDEAPDLAEKIRLGMSIDPKELKTITPDLRAQITAQLGGGIGILRKGAASTGTATRNVVQGVKEVSDYLSTASPDVINSMVSRLATSTDTVSRNLARGLSKLANQDKRGRQAVLFGLMQNPLYREKLQQMNQLEVEDESR